MSNYLGRCKGEGCGYALFATPEDITQGESFRDVRVGKAARVGNNGVFGRCPANHKVFPLKLVQGTYSESHKCDSRCLNAKGNDCTCSCGGANHGRGHVATVIEAGAESEVSGTHLGEVGKHIKGTAKVVTVKPLDESTLFVFRAKNGAIIKWFAPTYVSIVYAPGQEVTFRAKVKAHQEFRGEAQTIVTYLEEVEA